MNESPYQTHLARIDLFDEAIYLTGYQKNGQPGSCREISAIDLAVALAGQDVVSPLLPRNCLFWSRKNGSDRFIIYLEPAVRTLVLELNNERTPLRIPCPGLIWVAAGTDHNLYAVKQRPTRVSERLFAAPFPNVDGGSGDICWGKIHPVRDPGRAIPVFFEADFNDHWINACSAKYPNSILALWHELNQAQADTYPLDDLVKTNKKLGELL